MELPAPLNPISRKLAAVVPTRVGVWQKTLEPQRQNNKVHPNAATILLNPFIDWFLWQTPYLITANFPTFSSPDTFDFT
jgi:hypothetical protein